MTYRWQIPAVDDEKLAILRRETSHSSLLLRCLMNRGLNSADQIESFLQPRLKNLADPFLLPNMAMAVDRLLQARERKESVVIFGDYDVDGVCSAAMLLESLLALGLRTDAYLPNRMDEGYGLTRDGVANCLARGKPGVLLAVDCGSTSVETIAWLGDQGVDVLVLDHHQVSTPPPPAKAIVNPQLNTAEPGYRELCSAGLAFKLAHALVKRGRENGITAAQDYDVRTLLDLAALATIADMVPLAGENRPIVSIGLQRLAETTRPGLVALKQVAGVEGKIAASEVSFQLAPRLNAAGRLETAHAALDLIRAEDVSAALPIAQSLDQQNRKRQEIEREIALRLCADVRSRHNPSTDFVIVEGDASWHIGVVGIVASRIQREFYRPTIIFGGDGEGWRGSGRSVEGFDLAAALRQCADLLVRHGGHAMAAGVTIDPGKVGTLKERLNTLARETLTVEQFTPSLRLDAEIRLSEISITLVEQIAALDPTGLGNPCAQFAARNLRLASPPFRMGKEKQHAKLRVSDGRATQEAVIWNASELPAMDESFEMAFAPQINDYNGRRTVQLKVLDWRREQT